MISFVFSTVLPAVTTGAVTVPEFNSRYTGVPRTVFLTLFQKPYETWGQGMNVGGLTGRPDVRLMSQLGSKTNTNHLVLMDAVGNSLKGKVSSFCICFVFVES